MNCPHCNTANPTDAAFCSNCGKALEPANAPASGTQPSLSVAFPPPLPAPAPDAILPSTLGQLINYTFGVYQRTFITMVSITLLAQIPFLIASVLKNETAIILLTIAGLFTGLVASGAAAFAVAQFYVGRAPSAASSYAGAMNNGTSLLANGFIFGGAVFGCAVLTVLPVGIPSLTTVLGTVLLAFVLVSWFFYVQAVVIEGRGPVVALSRSWRLVRDAWWRTFLVGLVFLLIIAGIAVVLSLPGLALYYSKHSVLGDLLVSLAAVFVAPIAYIGSTLVYFDLRARKEGLTISRLASDITLVPNVPPSDGPGRPL